MFYHLRNGQDQDMDTKWPRPGHGYEMALQMVSGANFRCVLHHFPSLTPSGAGLRPSLADK